MFKAKAKSPMAGRLSQPTA